MTSGPSLQWVTRRFWPIVNDQVWHTLALAGALRQRGCAIEITTAAWHTSWPSQVQLREIDVHRIAPSPTTPFRARKYTRSLLERLDNSMLETATSGRPVGLLTQAAEDDALVLVDHFRSRLPVVVRYDAIDGLGPLSTRLRQRAIAACSQARMVIAPHDYARRELISAGLAPGQVHVVHDEPAQWIDRSPSARAAARRALSDINHELFLRSEDRAILCLTELTKNAGVEMVVQALGPLLEAQRGVRLWIVGDGPERLRLYDLVRRQGWRNEIMMPGTFEDPDVLLAAVDLCIVPNPQQGASWLMPAALVSGLPTLLCAGVGITARLGTCATGLTFEPDNGLKLQRLVQQWLKEPGWLGDATQKSAELLRGRTLELDAILF